LDAIKSENKLISTIQEQQLKTEIELDKENLDYMLIELDGQRYKFTNKIGKYVLAIC